ncbi:MAG TPA: SGNH/GDSL hydrolase family protein [Phycisphaerae bacterium]|nr:SGNH/GDSL hydrolase family protein [Phycisphaerae bacterium]
MMLTHMVPTEGESRRPGEIPPPPPGRRPSKRLALLITSLVLAIVGAEAAVRLLRLGPPVYAPHRFEPGGGIPFTRIENGPIVYQPNTVFCSVYDPAGDTRGYLGPDGRIKYEINQYGMRGPALPVEKTPGAYRIICLGDSITFGEGVRYADTYPARMADLLGAAMPGRRVEVINAGVQAYGTKDEAAFFLLRCLRFQPDVVTLGFFLNDATAYAETIRQNEAMTRDLDLSLPARISRIWEIIERRGRTAALQEEYFEAIRRGFQSSEWADCREVLKGLQQVGREDRFRLIVVLFPVLWELDGSYPFQDIHARIAEACRAAGCEFIDLLPAYRGRCAEDLWVHPTDQHPNEVAHGLAAKAIVDYLTSREPPGAQPPPSR